MRIRCATGLFNERLLLLVRYPVGCPSGVLVLDWYRLVYLGGYVRGVMHERNVAVFDRLLHDSSFFVV